MEKILIGTLLSWTLLSGGALIAQDDRDASFFDDDYTLYDRNQHGLDWNRFNYPDSKGKRR